MSPGKVLMRAFARRAEAMIPWCRRKCKQDFVGRLALHDPGYLRRVVNSTAIDHAADQRRIIVEVPDDHHFRTLGNRTCELPACRARAIDKHAVLRQASGGARPEQPMTRQKPRCRDGDEQQDWMDEAERPRNSPDAQHRENRRKR
jgi:hypothetical protein